MEPRLRISRSKLKEGLNGRRLVTRFAPSPTGFLHMGHLLNALYVWGAARAVGGEVILRMEDHDRNRCRPEYEAAILEDLEFLGLIPDRGTIEDFKAGATEFRQSSVTGLYAAQWQQLEQAGRGYVCACSRKQIKGRTLQPEGEEIRYDGFCRTRGLEDGRDMALRIWLPGEQREFDDLLRGLQVQWPMTQSGDVVLRDRKMNWSYQFAVVVDDLRQGVNTVIRGLDILSSTGRQLLMAELIADEKPDFLFAHHGLLRNTQGQKLSKQNKSPDIHARLLAGESAEMLLGEAAWRAGLLEQLRPVFIEELPELVTEK